MPSLFSSHSMVYTASANRKAAPGKKEAALCLGVKTTIRAGWGRLPKGGYPMKHFLRDVLAAWLAAVLAAVAVHFMNL